MWALMFTVPSGTGEEKFHKHSSGLSKIFIVHFKSVCPTQKNNMSSHLHPHPHPQTA